MFFSIFWQRLRSLWCFCLDRFAVAEKEVSQVISGTLKTVLGFILITAGGNVIISSLDVFGQMFNRAFSITGVIPNNEAIVAVAQSTFGTQTALIMVFGMVVNLFWPGLPRSNLSFSPDTIPCLWLA